VNRRRDEFSVLERSPLMMSVREQEPLQREFEEQRRSLTSYCYRMLGSVHEAEDAVQETMLRAWRSLHTFEDRSGLRPWLFRIATNVCFDALNGRAARALPMDVTAGDDGHGRYDLGAPLPESRWVQPLPARLADVDDPADVAVSRESIRLAFVAALQHLLPRQRAVLILRDVLRWRASEVAELLETSVDAVHSTLRRARRALEQAHGPAGPPTVDHPIDQALLARYIDAFERSDMAALVALLHEDAVVSMPPFAFWLRGREAFGRWLGSTGSACGHALVVPTEANGCPAAAMYIAGPDGALRPWGIHVLECRAGRIQAIHAFLDPGLFPTFGLPGAHAEDIGQPDEL
jgi:RNA polymerase sigma-70 factor, ECF subfamily